MVGNLLWQFSNTPSRLLFPSPRSYVRHLPDQDGEHGKSLARLCTYPYWPPHSLPRLMKRLVDRLIRSYLTVTLEGEFSVTLKLDTVGAGDR